jgi:hypothetical protein
MNKPVVDIFQSDDMEMPVDVSMPEKKKFPKKVPMPPGREPAHTVRATRSLTENEYKIFTVALNSVEDLKKKLPDNKEVSEELSSTKLKLLDVLAGKFGFPSALAAKEMSMGFNLKKNFEVELVKSRNG